MNVFTHAPTVPTAAQTGVVSPESACAWVKVDPDNEEVSDLLNDVLSWIEDYCEQPIFKRNHEVTLFGFEDGQFDSVFVTGIPSVHYRTTGSSELYTLLPVNYQLVNNGIVFKSSVGNIAQVEEVKITFTAGLDPLPGSIRQAIRYTLADWYDNRADGKRTAPSASQNLLSRYVLPHI